MIEKSAWPVALLLTAGLLPGCARYHAQPLAPADLAATFQARSLTNHNLRAFIATNLPTAASAWPLPSWDLTNLTLAALFFSPELDVARAKWASAEAGKRTAAARPNPTLSVSPAYNSTTHVPSPWLVSPTIDLPIETAGKRSYRLANASHVSEVARLNLASVAWQIRSRLRNAWFSLYAARQTLALLAQQQALQDENTRLLDLQFQAGAISAFELTQARIAADSTRLLARDAERQAAESQVDLAQAIGVPSRAVEQLPLNFAGAEVLPRDLPPMEVRQQALTHRTDILGALAEYAAAESALQLEIARQYPDVHLNPGYEFDQGDHKWAVGLSIDLPVLNQNQGPIAEALAKRTEAAASFNALQAQVLAEIEKGLASCRVALQKAVDADALRSHLQQQETRARAQLDAGEISGAELAALRLQLSASAVSRLESLTQARQALGQLEDALQSPLDWPASLWQSSPRLSKSAP